MLKQQSNNENPYIIEFDGYRAVAVIAVMLIHWGILGIGWIGVQMFFVLSGYLISANLLREKSEINNIWLYLKIFYWKRVLRLFPAYYLYVLVFLMIGVFIGREDILKLFIPLITYTINIYALVINHVDTAGVGHFWSLGVEEQFYFLWPILVFFISYNVFRKFLLVLIFIGPIIRGLLFVWASYISNSSHYVGEFIYMLPFGQIDAFAIGASLAFFSWEHIKRPKLIFFLVSCIVFFLGCLNGYLLLSDNLINKTNWFNIFSSFGFPHLMLANYQYVWGYTALNLVFGLLILCILKKENPFPFLNNSILVYIGKISYGIYIFHVPVLVLIRKVFKGKFLSVEGILFMVTYFLLTFLIAHVSYKYYEKRFLTLKKKINK